MEGYLYFLFFSCLSFSSLFLAALGLCCCAWPFSSCSVWASLWVMLCLLNKLHIYYYKIAFFLTFFFFIQFKFSEINIAIIHLLSSFQFQPVYVLIFDNSCKTCSGFCFILLSDNLCFSFIVFGPFTFNFYYGWFCLSSCYLFYIYATFSCFFYSFISSLFCANWCLKLWPPQAKSWLIGKDPNAGKDWGQEEKGTTEDEMAGWHHWLDGHGFG